MDWRGDVRDRVEWRSLRRANTSSIRTTLLPFARQPPSQASPSAVTRLVTILLLLFGFLVGVKGLGEGFKLLGGDFLELIFSTTENPFIGLVVGILATTIVQSSSVTTSMIVGLVAAPESPLPAGKRGADDSWVRTLARR